MTILKEVHLPLLGSLSVRAKSDDLLDAVPLRVPDVMGLARPGMPRRWLEGVLVGPRDRQMRLVHLIRHVAQKLIGLAGPDAAEELAKMLLALTCVVTDGADERSAFFESVAEPVPTRLMQYVVLNGGSSTDPRSMSLGDFTVGRFDAEAFIYETHRAGSKDWDAIARARRGELCIVRQSESKTLPLCTKHMKLKAGDRAIVNGLVDAAYQALADGSWREFWRGLEEAQLVSSALRCAYVDVDCLRLSGSIGADLWTVFSRVAGGRAGWVSPMVSGMTMIMPQQDAYRSLQKIVAEGLGFAGWRDTEVSNTTRNYCRMLWRAKSLGNVGRMASSEQVDDAFLRHMIALEMLFNEKTATASAVGRRVSVIVHRMCQKSYQETKKVLDNLYDVRSRFVHQGKGVTSEHLSRVAEITSCCAEWLLLLDRRGSMAWGKVMLQLDLLAANLEAERAAPLDVLEELAIPTARCLPGDLLSGEE